MRTSKPSPFAVSPDPREHDRKIANIIVLLIGPVRGTLRRDGAAPIAFTIDRGVAHSNAFTIDRGVAHSNLPSGAAGLASPLDAIAGAPLGPFVLEIDPSDFPLEARTAITDVVVALEYTATL